MTKPLFVAENERKQGFTHVVLILTGSVASIKAPLIVSELLTVGPIYTKTTTLNEMTIQSLSMIE